MSRVGEVGDWSEVAVAMDRCLRAFTEFVKPILAEHDANGLSITNLVFMLSLGHGEARVNDVVRGGRYLGSNASYALKSLQDGGFIARRQDPDDRRNGIVSWTDRGRAIALAISTACRVDATDAASAIAILRAFEGHCAPETVRG